MKKWGILFLFFFLIVNCKDRVYFVKAEKGFVDLSEWKFAEKPILQLDGDWEFYWKELPEPNEFKQFFLENPVYHEMPYAWTDILWKQKNLSAEGYATFHLKADLPKGHPRLAILTGEQGTSYQIYSGRKKVLGKGIVSKTKQESVPDPTGSFAFLPSTKKLNLVLQISNYHHRAGGPWSGIIIGEANAVKNYWMIELIEDAFISGILLFLAGYHFMFFFLRRRDKVHILFASFLFTMFIRLITTGNKILSVTFPIIPYEILFRLEYLGFYFGSTFLYHFLRSFFPQESSLLALRFMYAASLASALSLFLDPLLASQVIPIYQIVFLIKLGFATVTILMAIFRKRTFAGLISFGAFFCMLTAINDILHSRQFIQTGYFIQYGVLLLVSTETLALSMTFTKAFHSVESMKDDLIKINISYQRFIPAEFLKFLGRKSIQDIALGDQTQKMMTILFSDIRDFTALSEQMTPDENFLFLNSYLKRMSPIVTKNHGFIDKYIGDGIMALFPRKAEDGLLAAIQMQEELYRYNEARKAQGFVPIKIGIGLHTGNLILGTIGSDNRMDGTVISDAVNLSSRLESLTKYYGVGVVISGDSFQSIDNYDKYDFRILDVVKVKGKTNQITVIHIYSGLPENIKIIYKKTKDLFERGINYFWMQNFQAAKEQFQKVLEIHPEDRAAQIYLTRSEYFSHNPIPPDWDGSFSMLEK